MKILFIGDVFASPGLKAVKALLPRIIKETGAGFVIANGENTASGYGLTVDTVRDLKAERPDVDWVLVIGSDTLVDLHNWYKIDELLELCEVASFARPGENDLERVAAKVKLPDRHKNRLIENVFETRLIEISSTEIRSRVAEGLSARYIVPADVETYILKHGLYQD